MSIRKIVYGGYDTLTAGLRICSERSSVTGADMRTAKETIPYHDGALTVPTGREPRRLTYCLILQAANRAALDEKARVIEEAFAGKKGDLIDSDLVNMKYMNAVFISAEPLEYVSRNFRNAYMTVHFEADPVPQAAGAVNERVFKGASRGGGTLTVTGNAAWSWAHNDTSEAGTYTAAEPYTYRLEAFAENAVTATLNGDPLTIGAAFTMPASATIVITLAGAGGIGYYELWHDTREVRV